MAEFQGFPTGRTRFISVPQLFFTELLPQIDNLNELKVVLYALWQLDKMEGSVRYLQIANFTQDETFMQGLDENPKKATKALEDGLDRAVGRGALLQASVSLDHQRQSLYFLNTARGQAAIQAIQAGKWQPTGNESYPIELKLEKPNVFNLYEEHIGPITPMIAEALKDAEESYSAEWIEEAVRIAVENNVRKWRYVEAILERWQKEGRHERRDQEDSQESGKKYVEGDFADFIEH